MSTSPTATIIDDRTTQERWIEHVKGKLSMASSKVVLIGGSAISTVSYLWPATTIGQGAVMDALGVAGVWRVLVPLMLAWAFAAFTPPKPGQVPKWALDTFDELAREKLSARLVAAGHAPLPPKPAAVTAEPNVMVIGAPVPTVPPPAAAPPAPAPAPPMPGTAVMGDMRTLLTPTPDSELAQRLRAAAPWKSDLEIAGAVAAWVRPPTVISP